MFLKSRQRSAGVKAKCCCEVAELSYARSRALSSEGFNFGARQNHGCARTVDGVLAKQLCQSMPWVSRPHKCLADQKTMYVM